MGKFGSKFGPDSKKRPNLGRVGTRGQRKGWSRGGLQEVCLFCNPFRAPHTPRLWTPLHRVGPQRGPRSSGRRHIASTYACCTDVRQTPSQEWPTRREKVGVRQNVVFRFSPTRPRVLQRLTHDRSRPRTDTDSTLGRPRIDLKPTPNRPWIDLGVPRPSGLGGMESDEKADDTPKLADLGRIWPKSGGTRPVSIKFGQTWSNSEQILQNPPWGHKNWRHGSKPAR